MQHVCSPGGTRAIVCFRRRKRARAVDGVGSTGYSFPYIFSPNLLKSSRFPAAECVRRVKSLAEQESNRNSKYKHDRPFPYLLPSHAHRGRVVRAAALALCSLTLKNQANKTRCGSLDAVAILLDLAAAWGIAEEGGR